MTDQPPEAPEAPEPPRSRGSIARTITIALVGLALPVLGLIMLVRSCARTAVSGEVFVRGEPAWRQPLNRCRSGEFQGFFGVDLGRDSDGKMMVRAQLDPERGPRLELTPPQGGAPIKLDTTLCPGLRVEVRKVGADADGAAFLDGSVVARCTPPGGPVVQVDGWWRHCGPT